MSVYSLSDKVKFFESIFGQGRLSANGINFDVRCPVCAPTDPSKKKLSIRTDNDANHCWVCGWKARSLVPILRKYGTQSQIEKYREFFGDSRVNSLVTGEKEEVQKIELPKDFRLLTLASDQDPDAKAVWRYLYSRGLDEKDAWYFKFGISDDPKWKRRVIMPSFDFEGKLNYFVARAIDKNRKPKYDNPRVDHKQLVFNEININWKKPLVLVEGPFDMTKCPTNTTALLGSDFDEQHELFNRVLLHNTPVHLAMDGDMWYTKIPKIYKKLLGYNVDAKVVDVRAWGDPGNMSKIQFEQALSESKYLSWNDNFMSKLEKLSINF